MKKNISLIGMSGAGKTTTAIELGKLLKNFAVIDTDKFIEKKENITISEIFEKFGEKYFRQLENDVINEILKGENLIVSLGGGVYESSENRQIIKKNSIVIYLKANPDVLYQRLKDTNNRPLLKNHLSADKITEILNKRDKNYIKSDIIIETDNKTPGEVALLINEVLKNEF